MWSRIAIAMTCLVALPAFAGPVTLPWTFQPDTPAVASQVNDNFGAVVTGVNGNATDIAALQAQLTALQGTVAALQSTVTAQGNTITTLQANVTTLTSQLNAVATNPVLGLGAYVSLQMLSDPQSGIDFPTAVFDSVNVQIVNGTGATESANGLGNLTLGYNEADPGALEFCSDGAYDANEATCTANGGTWAANQRSGSHVLVAGYSNAYTWYGGLVVGVDNVGNGPYASVSGGQYNTAGGYSSSVSGGYGNAAGGIVSSVSGGSFNTASGQFSSVSGGEVNFASGASSSVSGGDSNTASGDYSSVSGGQYNAASGGISSVSGGQSNAASGDDSSVSGGVYGTASGWVSSVSGGYLNTASGAVSSVSGGNGRSVSGDYDWAAGALWQDQ